MSLVIPTAFAFVVLRFDSFLAAMKTTSSGSSDSAASDSEDAANQATPNRVLDQKTGADRRRSARPDEARVLEHFRRLRGPAELLRDHDRDPLREHLVMIHAPLVEHCARSLSSSEDLLEDLVQEGNIGLIKAVDRYDPEKGVRFSTYACHLITGEMRHYLRDLGKMIHEPGWHSELRRQVERAAEDLIQKLGRPPRPEEVGHALDMQPQVVRKVLESSKTLSVSSLDTDDDDDESPSKLRLFDESDYSLPLLATSVEDRITLGEALPQLREQEKRAVTMFYYGEKTKTEVARELGVSVNYAAYLIKKGLEQLRKIIESEAPLHLAAPPLPSTIAWHDLPRWVDENKSSLLRAVSAAYEAPQNYPTTNELSTPNDNQKHLNGTSNGNSVVPGLALETPSAKAASAKAPNAKNEYSMLLFRIANWREATANFNVESCRESNRLVAELTRRSCRKADKIVSINAAPFGGLALIALVGGGEIVGQRVRERWMKACAPTAIAPPNAAIAGELQKQFAVVSAPRDGKEPQQLVQKLEELAQDAQARAN